MFHDALVVQVFVNLGPHAYVLHHERVLLDEFETQEVILQQTEPLFVLEQGMAVHELVDLVQGVRVLPFLQQFLLSLVVGKHHTDGEGLTRFLLTKITFRNRGSMS